jgi:hypothetical protein
MGISSVGYGDASKYLVTEGAATSLMLGNLAF